MPPQIRELKKLAVDAENRVSDILRHALVLSVELELEEFEYLIRKELEGYGLDDWENDRLPSYRVVHCRVMALNPYRGWQPIMFDQSPELGEKLSRVPIIDPIGKLEAFGDEDMAIMFDVKTAATLRKAIGADLEINRHITSYSVTSIVDAVRNRILDWTIKLEKSGVTGKGERFTNEEISTAKTVTNVHIGHVENMGVLGDISGSAVVDIDQVSGITERQLLALKELFDEIERHKAELDLDEDQQVELADLLTSLKSEIDKPDSVESKIGSLLSSLKSMVESSVGNLVASGIIHQLNTIFPSV